jgi:hypothetical protein
MTLLGGKRLNRGARPANKKTQGRRNGGTPWVLL